MAEFDKNKIFVEVICAPHTLSTFGEAGAEERCRDFSDHSELFGWMLPQFSTNELTTFLVNGYRVSIMNHSIRSVRMFDKVPGDES